MVIIVPSEVEHSNTPFLWITDDNTVIPRLVRSLRVRILGMLSFEDVQNDSGYAF